MRDHISRRTGLQRHQRGYVEGLFFFFNPAAYCSPLRSSLLFPDPEGSDSSSPPAAVSVSSALALLPPWSWAFSASALGSPLAHLHLHRQPGTREPALTSEEIADHIGAADHHCTRPPDPPSPCLGLLHGPFDLLPLQMALQHEHTRRSRPRPTSACQTGSRARTAATWSGELLPAHAVSPRNCSSVPSPIALILSTTENKLVEDHPKVPLSPPCAVLSCATGVCSAARKRQNWGRAHPGVVVCTASARFFIG